MTLPATIAIGAACGTLLFATLAREWRLVPTPPRSRLRPLAGRLARLAPRGAAEEVVWRGLVLGGLRGGLGVEAAFCVATAGFAAAHYGQAGTRSVAVHAVTGSTFGFVFLLTGSLVGAISSHVAYNSLVAAAVERARAP